MSKPIKLPGNHQGKGKNQKLMHRMVDSAHAIKSLSRYISFQHIDSKSLYTSVYTSSKEFLNLFSDSLTFSYSDGNF